MTKPLALPVRALCLPLYLLLALPALAQEAPLPGTIRGYGLLPGAPAAAAPTQPAPTDELASLPEGEDFGGEFYRPSDGGLVGEDEGGEDATGPLAFVAGAGAAELPQPTAQERAGAHFAAAQRLVQALNPLATIRQLIHRQLDAQGQAEAIAQWADRYLLTHELTDALATVYMREFTAAELEAAAAFYGSEAGRAFATRQPALAARGEALGTALARKYRPQLERMLSEPPAPLVRN